MNGGEIREIVDGYDAKQMYWRVQACYTYRNTTVSKAEEQMNESLKKKTTFFSLDDIDCASIETEVSFTRTAAAEPRGVESGRTDEAES